MKKMYLLIGWSIIAAGVNAQTAAKSIYAELGGQGVASINFDSRFSPREGGIGGRLGIGGFATGGFGMFTIPVEVNYLLGNDGKNYLELGAGFTYLHSKGDLLFEDDDNNLSSEMFGHLTLGYRLQPAKGGFLFRAAIVPVFGKGYFIPYYAGIAFGYKF